MIFSIDPLKYRVIDLSYEVIPCASTDRPFDVAVARLADDTFRYDVLRTHTHVGTHVEVPWHFFREGQTLSDCPLDTFYGRALLLSCRRGPDFPPSRHSTFSRSWAPSFGRATSSSPATIPAHLTKGDISKGNRADAPHFTPEAAEWLREHRIKLLGIDFIRLGIDVPAGRRFHEILMGQGVPFVEIMDNLQSITKSEFFFMALPFRVRGIDSGWVRAVAIEER